MDFMNSLDYLEILKMFYLSVFYLGNLIKNLIDKEWFWKLCDNSVFLMIIMFL
jgi:hypothetical protein